jgi:hypothetical protein
MSWFDVGDWGGVDERDEKERRPAAMADRVRSMALGLGSLVPELLGVDGRVVETGDDPEDPVGSLEVDIRGEFTGGEPLGEEKGEGNHILRRVDVMGIVIRA